jgi:hypothetical protein
MDRLFAAALSACQFDGAVGDDLVDIHVRLRAAAGLPDAERELIGKLARDDLVRCSDNQVGLISGEFFQFEVDLGAGLFEDAKGADERPRHPILPDGKVDERASRLSAVVAIGRHLDGAHTIRFDAGWFAHGMAQMTEELVGRVKSRGQKESYKIPDRRAGCPGSGLSRSRCSEWGNEKKREICRDQRLH